ncbi:MAG: hypothetical protein AB1348_08065 [Nitrospirota bacterium]
MKKALTLIVIMVGAVIVMSSVAMAQLDQKPIPVTANVAKYAGITPSGGPLNLLNFGGWPDELRTDGAGIFTVETNTTLDLLFDFDLTHESDPTSSLITYFSIYNNTDGVPLTPGAPLALVQVSQPGGNLFTNAQAAKTTKSYSVTVGAKTGATISAQEAGNYTGAVTLTVSAP